MTPPESAVLGSIQPTDRRGIVLDGQQVHRHYFSHCMTTPTVGPREIHAEITAGFPAFSPPPILRNPHIQTVVASRMPRRWRYGWKVWEPMEVNLGAAGRILAEVSWQPGKRPQSPTLILLHGLEGSARSHYLLGISKKAYDAGFHTIRVNTRNCGGTEHMTPTLYCAGLSQDVEVLVKHLVEECRVGDIYASGVSLGANILLKYLGELGERAAGRMRAAAVLSPPIDLERCVLKMEEPQNWVYQRHFVNRLKERIRRKRVFYPEIADPHDIDRVRTIYEFDDLITAPHFGWGTADNYYRLASSGPLLSSIRIPTLIIQSTDDPLIPFQIFREAQIEDNPFIHLAATEYGGHSGFMGIRPARAADQDSYWAESRIVQFLSTVAGTSGSGTQVDRDCATDESLVYKNK